MKQKESWLCSECGHSEPKWSGSCRMCNNWNTMVRFIEKEQKNTLQNFQKQANKARALHEIGPQEIERFQTGYPELDRIMGGGVVKGSLSLVGGDPGVGKSTLMLMLANQFCKKGKKVLYVCGEESIEQTSLRAQRLGIKAENLYLFAETLFSSIQSEIESLQPDVFVLDSIQIVYKGELSSLPGSVTQVKEIAMECMHIAKQLAITTFLIGHVTKSGELAGPRVLEHIVDTVLDFEGDRDHGLRILRGHKNRFGPTDEVAMFQMNEKGLEEVPNPSMIFLKERMKESTGSAVIPTMEGSRSILVEVQALVAPSAFSNSSRRASGIDQNRLALLLAVLEKRMGYHFHNLDVFVSLAGGLRVREPAIDLGITLAIASSFCNRAIDPNCVLIGEVGLGGEVRSVPRIESRIKEAMHMGFTKVVLPRGSIPKRKQPIELIGVDKVDQVISALLS